MTERYAFYSPSYLAGAVQTLDGLIRLVVGPVAGQSSENEQESRSSSGVEQRIRKRAPIKIPR